MRPAGAKWLVVVLSLTLGITVGVTLPASVASAQSSQARGIDLLSRAKKAYEAGAYSDASDLIDSAFKVGLTGDLASRAILLRAEINEKTGSYAKALQDYSNALWMDTLPPADKKKATEGKERVMAVIGSGSSRPASAQASAAPQSAAVASGGDEGGVFGFLSGVFSGAGQPAARPVEAQQASPSAQSAPPPSSVKTPAQPKPKPAKVAQAKPSSDPSKSAARQPSASSAASVATSGGILIVFGTAANEASGRATAKTIKAQLSDILINRELDVTPRPSGGFQIQAGPYQAKSSAMALCSAMKQRGVQCQVTQ